MAGVSAVTGLSAETSQQEEIASTSQMLQVTLAGAPAAVDYRMARFDAAADMPADMTSAANVTADLITFSGFSATANKVRLQFHTPLDTYTGTTAAGPVCTGAYVTINAPDSATAITRLTYTDLTGGGTSSSGVPDTFFLSQSCPEMEILLPAGSTLTSVYAVGVYAGFTPTNITPAFLSVIGLG